MDAVVDLITELGSRTQPALTWYGPDDERVDLTGRVSANWIIKAANLLSMELAVEPGAAVWLDLPPHWRSVVWAHAAWCLGAEITTDPAGADVAVTAHGAPEQPMDTIVIALPALARAVADLPPGTIDGAADLMTQADDFMFPPEGGPSDPTGLGLTQAELLGADLALRPLSTGTPGLRVLIQGAGLTDLLRVAPGVWARGGSLVITQEPSERLIDAEGITHLVGAPGSA